MKKMKLTESLAQGAEMISVGVNDTNAKTVKTVAETGIIKVDVLNPIYISETKKGEKLEKPFFSYKVVGGQVFKDAVNVYRREDGTYTVSSAVRLTNNELYLSKPQGKEGGRFYRQAVNEKQALILAKAQELMRLDSSLKLPDAVATAMMLMQ